MVIVIDIFPEKIFLKSHRKFFTKYLDQSVDVRKIDQKCQRALFCGGNEGTLTYTENR